MCRGIRGEEEDTGRGEEGERRRKQERQEAERRRERKAECEGIRTVTNWQANASSLSNVRPVAPFSCDADCRKSPVADSRVCAA